MPFALRNIPVVRAVIFASVGLFLLEMLVGLPTGFPIAYWFSWTNQPPKWYVLPWTWVTYPLVELSPINLIFMGYWFYGTGGMLERSWGSKNFLVLILAFAAITALPFVPAWYLFGIPWSLGGLLILNCTLTVAWAALDPYQEVDYWGIAKPKARTLSLLTVLVLYFWTVLATHNPLLSLLILAGPAAGWLYVRKLPRLNVGFRATQSQRPPRLLREDVIPRERPGRRESVGGFNPLRRRQEQQEIEALKKLLGEEDER